jgi:Ca-activated chloride channel family protein
VDTASYSIVRRFLSEGQLPPKDAVRVEELINYFPYAYAPPRDGRPFAVHMDTTACPWEADHRLVRIGIKGRELPPGQRPPSNLVFLLDVSGSMDQPNKLPLVKAAMRLLVEQLGARDRVAIAVYAGSEGLALPSTPGSEKAAILSAIESLSPGGTTHGSAGIRLAYETAAESFIDGGVNRVILATDGDFNVGVTNQGDLVRLIEDKAKSGVFLTALGFGMGNLKDSTLEKLADHGNGNYAYIDSLAEARKVLVEQAGGTLVTIAKDVKLQIEFNPAHVKAFRLIGYENRVLAHQDFNDDTKDAGDIGAGHTVTALYEVVPPGVAVSIPGVDPLKYQEASRPIAGSDTGEILTLKLRYKEPAGQRSSLIEVPLTDSGHAFEAASPELRFAAAVAAFGMILRDSPHKGDADFGKVREWAAGALGQDRGGLRAEFLQMVDQARALSAK